MNSNQIREITSTIVEDARPESSEDIPLSEIKLRALQAMMIGEIAAQLAELNEKFSPKTTDYGTN